MNDMVAIAALNLHRNGSGSMAHLLEVRMRTRLILIKRDAGVYFISPISTKLIVRIS